MQSNSNKDSPSIFLQAYPKKELTIQILGQNTVKQSPYDCWRNKVYITISWGCIKTSKKTDIWQIDKNTSEGTKKEKLQRNVIRYLAKNCFTDDVIMETAESWCVHLTRLLQQTKKNSIATKSRRKKKKSMFADRRRQNKE